jgi:pentatricopeptide repeat protein
MPDIKHYDCLIDLLCRCGLVEEAYKMAKELPVKTNTVLWKTILSQLVDSWGTWSMDAVFKELQGVGPFGREELITMSNVYAEARRWQDVERLRENGGFRATLILTIKVIKLKF